MLYNKSHLSVRHAASTDETRMSINGVRFKADGSTEATNGDWLLRARPHKQEPEEFPTIQDAAIKLPAPELKPFTLPKDTADALVKRLPKKQTMLPILSNALLDVAGANDNGFARFVTTDLETEEITQGRKIEAEFPDTDQVMPDEPPVTSFGIDLEYLAKLYKAVCEFGDKGHTVVKVEVFGPTDEMRPIRLTYHNPDFGELMAIIMPVRITPGELP